MKDLISQLKKESFFKLILGLGNCCVEDIKKISGLYALSGADMFDFTPSEEIYEAIYEGIKNCNLNPEDYFYCLSFSLGKDKHGQKAHIDKKKCVKCLKCIKKCPQDAIFYDKEEKVVKVISKKCIGCEKCGFCPAISFSKAQTDIFETLDKLTPKYKLDCVELHVTGSKFDDIKTILKKIKTKYPKISISICVSRERFSDTKLMKFLNKCIKIIGKDKFIFQADGRSMSGAKDDFSSTLQAVSTAQITQELEINTILSGGTNSKTAELAKMCSVKINGVAIGSYGRILVKEEIKNPEFWYNNEVFSSALNKTKRLVNSVKQ